MWNAGTERAQALRIVAAQRARQQVADDSVSAQTVQDRPLETGARRGGRIDMDRIEIAIETVEQCSTD